MKARGAALDLGSGALSDSRYLIEQGFSSVTAVDLEPGPPHIAGRLPEDRFTQVLSSFEDFAFPPETYDLVTAQFALPFIRPERFSVTFEAIVGSLRSGGVLTGQFFGERDDWYGDPSLSFHSEAEARRQLELLAITTFEEEDDADSATAAGDAKHWHIFHFIATKP